MNGLLSRIFGRSPDLKVPTEAEGVRESPSLMREWRVVVMDYSNCEAPRSGKSWFAPVASFVERLMSQEYERIAAASDLEANFAGAKEGNSCGVLPSAKLEGVEEVSTACSSKENYVGAYR